MLSHPLKAEKIQSTRVPKQSTKSKISNIAKHNTFQIGVLKQTIPMDQRKNHIEVYDVYIQTRFALHAKNHNRSGAKSKQKFEF